MKFYGVNTLAMTPLQRFIAEENMAALKAEDALREYGHLMDADDVKEWTLTATLGDEEVAEKAWEEAAARQLAKGD